jgi:hypothetical protein
MNTSRIAQFFASGQTRTQPLLVLGSAETDWSVFETQLQQMLEIKPADTVTIATPPSIVDLRQTVGRIQLRPMHGTRTLVIFGQFEQWSAELATTILKTIEEPPAFAVIVLCASRITGILPTIRSRVATLRLVEQVVNSKKEEQNYTANAVEVVKMPLKDQFGMIQKLADNDSKASVVLGDWLATSPRPTISRQLLQLATLIGETPVNRRLALESAALLMHTKGKII